MALDADRRASLERGRATAIARDSFAVDAASASVSAAPFGVVVDAGDQVVIVSSSADLAVLGGVLVWAARNPRSRIDLVVEHHAGVHARRAAVLAPELSVHLLDGAQLTPATAASIAAPHPTPDDIAPLVAMIERSGATAVVEDGIVRAEVVGLEVGRVVTGPAGSTFEVGVGRFDREAGAMLHADRPVEPTLVTAIERALEHRRPGTTANQYNRIGRERWLRSAVLAEPARFGLDDVEPVEPVPPRVSLLEIRPAAVIGSAGEARVLAVCTVGADLGLVPEIADLVAVHQPDEVRLLMPERDHLPFVEHLVGLLPVPASIEPIDPPWESA